MSEGLRNPEPWRHAGDHVPECVRPRIATRAAVRPYSLPDFGSLQKDPLLPQRCQDPTVMQVGLVLRH